MVQVTNSVVPRRRTVDELRDKFRLLATGQRIIQAHREGRMLRDPAERLVHGGAIRTCETVVEWTYPSDDSRPRVELWTLWNVNEATGLEYRGEQIPRGRASK